MAFLVLLFLSSHLNAAADVHSLATQSLMACDFKSASYVAQELSAEPHLEKLYRLAWYQLVPIRGTKRNETREREYWKWAWSGELWRDEYVPKSECTISSVLASSIEAQSLLSWYSDVNQNYAKLGLKTRQLLRTVSGYFLSEKLMASRIAFKADKVSDTHELCELRSLDFLETNSPNPSQALSWISTQCTAVISPITAHVRIKIGDSLVLAGQYREALTLYQLAEKDFYDDEIIVPKLRYKIAILSDEMQGHDDIFFRTAVSALQSETLPIVYQSLLRDRSCRKIADSDPKISVKVLKKVFEINESLLQHLVLPCLGAENIWNLKQTTNLVSLARKLGQKPLKEIKLTGELLTKALTSSNELVVWLSSRLAYATKDYHGLAAPVFWKSVLGNKTSRAEKAVRVFEHNAKLDEFDTLMLSRFKNSSNKQHKNDQVIIKNETATVHNELDLRDLRRSIDLKIKYDWSLDFHAAAIESLDLAESK